MKTRLLLYCTKAKPYLLHMPKDNEEFEKGIEFSLTDGKEFAQACLDVNNYKLNGKIVAECDFEVEEMKNYFNNHSVEQFNKDSQLYLPDFISYITKGGHHINDLAKYVKENGNIGYAIHIKNLHIFDEPRELSEYFTGAKKMNTLDGYSWVCESIDRAPQNMRYCYDDGEKCILISIRPEWLCKILNGEKTIEVRKKTLKEML